jgi:hypothetical protein
LSKNNLSFNAEGGIDSVVMGGTFWWLNYPLYRGCKGIWSGDETNYCNDNYCERNEMMKIECSWLSVTKIDEYTLLVSVDKNNTNEEKNISIGVESGNCSSGFSITQASKFPKELWFNAKGGIDNATTEGEWHYIRERFTVGDTVITLLSNKEQCSKIFPFEKDNKIYICTDEIPFFESEDYPRGIVGIEYSWFTINKPDKKKVIFSVKENKTGKNRKFGISLEAEDYDTSIWVNQSAE